RRLPMLFRASWRWTVDAPRAEVVERLRRHLIDRETAPEQRDRFRYHDGGTVSEDGFELVRHTPTGIGGAGAATPVTLSGSLQERAGATRVEVRAGVTRFFGLVWARPSRRCC